MKGIILAGGSGTRLYPMTKATSKQLLPVYDKPMIYYPLSTLMMAGVREILIITTKEDQDSFKRLLGDGSQFGISLQYIIQPEPKGLAQAFTLGQDFIGNETSVMILGDNIFYGAGLESKLNQARDNAENGLATIFGYQVKDPTRFGIMELDEENNVLSVEEKPQNPKSDYCITGLYFYPKGVSEKAHLVTPSARGEVEITTLNNMYLKEGNLKAQVLDAGYTWFDTGTFESMNEAANMIRAIQIQGRRVINCPEMIAYGNKWITIKDLEERGNEMAKNDYGQYLLRMAKKR